MFNRRLLIAAALASPVLAAGGALAQSTPKLGVGLVTTYSADARITAIDPNARTVTLTFANGAVVTRKVSPALANFNALKVGDMVSVDFEDRLTLVVSPPNAKPPPDRALSVEAAVTTDQSAAGMVVDEAIANFWVTGVDPANGKVSLVNPAGGPVHTYSVATPEGRQLLPQVKPGDYVTAIDKQYLVAAITPKA
jgi:hypothetical protein